MEQITFFCKRDNTHGFHEAWPRRDESPTQSVIKWLGGNGFSMTVLNRFTDIVVHNVETRNMGKSNVPRAIIPLPDKGISVKIDFRVDGMFDLVRHGTIIDGVIKTPMKVVFSRGKYALVPIVENDEKI